MSGKNWVLAIDVGSSSVRAGIFDFAHTLIAESRRAREDTLNGMTFDTENLWAQIAHCVTELPEDLRADVRCLSVAAHVGTVFLDRDHHAVGPAYGWADASGLDLLSDALGTGLDRYLSITGRPALTGGPVPRLLSVRQCDSAAYRRIAHVLAPKDFINARLTGRIATDLTSAAYFGALDVLNRCWSEDILRNLSLEEGIMPPVLASVDVLGTVSVSAAAALGLKIGLPVVAGGPDGTIGASFVLAGRSGCLADIAGTTDVLVKQISHLRQRPAEVLLNPYIDGTSWTIGGPTGSTGGAVAQWARMLGYGLTADADFESDIASVAPGSEGLIVRPFLTGSRFPRWRSQERGAVFGQCDIHQRRHFMRAICEGAGFATREGIDLLAGSDTSACVVLAGGAARSKQLAQMRADIFNRTVLVVSEADVSLFGAARLAVLVAASAEARNAPLAPVRTIEPNETRARAYDRIYQRWLQA